MRSGVIRRRSGMTRLVHGGTGSRIPVNASTSKAPGGRDAERPRRTCYAALPATRKVREGQRANLQGDARSTLPWPRSSRSGRSPKFRVDPETSIEVGEEITANHRFEGQFATSGTSIGKGFQGAMSNGTTFFSGLRATHGRVRSRTARNTCSTGQFQDPGPRVHRAEDAGHMGAARVTTLKLQSCAPSRTGASSFSGAQCPVSKRGWVTIKDAVKKPVPGISSCPRP